MTTDQAARPRSVAIVGSGSAGAAATYRLRELLGPDARLVVLERADRVGGRVHSMEFAGTRVEVGGTLIHSSNRRLGDLLAEVGLAATTPDLDLDGRAETLAIWDGRAFVFWSRTSTAPLAWSLIRRYGLRNVLRLRSQTVRALTGFTQVYAQQDAGRLFRTPRELLEGLGLGDRADLSLHDFLAGEGIQGRLVGELVEGILRNMYNQNATINAMAGSVALIGGGFGGGSLYSVGGGNATLFERVLDRAGAELRLNHEVVRIATVDADGRRWHTVSDQHGGTERVDAVVIAAPLEHASIDLTDVAADDRVRRARPYQTVHATLVAGELSTDYFGAARAARLPSHILTMAADGLPFTSIGVTGWSPAHSCRIYKVFSPHPLDADLLGAVFSAVHEVDSVVWQAYPVLDPDPLWPSFQLAEGVYYVNAFESAVSTLETEAVAAWNVAGLVAASLD